MNRHSRAAAALAAWWFAADAPARAAEIGTWQPLAPLTLARQEVGAARVGNRVWVVGGLIAGFEQTESVEVYDLGTGTWSAGPDLPVALDHMGVAAIGPLLYVAGGYERTGTTRATDGLWVLDTQSAAGFAALEPLPEPRAAPWLVSFAGRLYLFGGVDGAGVVRDTTYVYDPGLDAWSEGAPMPTAREHTNAAVLGRFIHVVGGRNGGSSTAHERYDPAANQWLARAALPTGRSAAAVAALGGRLWVAGGEVPQLFAVHEVYDPQTNTWQSATAMAVPRHGIAAVPIDGAVLAPAGGTVQGLAPTSFADRFVPRLVFADRFELGDLSLWAAAPPNLRRAP